MPSKNAGATSDVERRKVWRHLNGCNSVGQRMHKIIWIGRPELNVTLNSFLKPIASVCDGRLLRLSWRSVGQCVHTLLLEANRKTERRCKTITLNDTADVLRVTQA